MNSAVTIQSPEVNNVRGLPSLIGAEMPTISGERLLIPKQFVDLQGAPLIFLAGPIRGAELWQDLAARYILSTNPDVYVASPQRFSRPEIAPFIRTGEDGRFSHQRFWERFYIGYALHRGAVLMWLPKEVDHKCDKAFGSMTRVEFGQITTHYRFDNSIRFCLGTDGEFSEINTMMRDFVIDVPDKELLPTLRASCDEAIRLAMQNPGQ